MKEEGKNYELTFVVASENDYNELLEIVRSEKIELSSQTQPSKIKLAYPIKKENFGYFGSMYFSATAEDVQKLNKALRSNLKILRFFIFNKPTIKEVMNKRSGRLMRRQNGAEKIPEGIPPVSPTEKPGILTNEALEKRLEEILK